MATRTPKETCFKIQLHTSFEFAYHENVTNVAVALAQAGYFIDIERKNGGYKVNVYKQV